MLLCDGYFVDVALPPLSHLLLAFLMAAWTLHPMLVYGAWLRTSCMQLSQTQIWRPRVVIVLVTFYVILVVEVHSICPFARNYYYRFRTPDMLR